MPDEPSHTVVASERASLRRKRERGSHERSLVDSILDEALFCHVGFTDDGSTFVVPTAFARVGDSIYFHGAAANRTLKALASGIESCVTVTLLDGLVLARSAFHHSMNYRSVILFGTAVQVNDPDEKLSAVLAILDHLVPGRSEDARPPSPSELRATQVVRFAIEEGSAKVREGGPIEEAEDLGLGVWAGELPIELVTMAPVPDEAMADGVGMPSYVARYRIRRVARVPGE